MGNLLTFNLGQYLTKFEVWHLVVALIVLYYLPSILKWPVWLCRTIGNRQAAKRMLQERNAKHFAFNPIDEKLGNRLLTMTVAELRRGLMAGEFKSIDLVNFFGARAQKVGRELNYSTEELFISAFEKAKKCDEERERAMKARTEHELPFLHGIPISVKELINQEKCRVTVGCAMNQGRAKRDAAALLPFLRSGAIPLVRGNVPQGALSTHTTNYVWGRAKNVFDHDRSCGGSSGGDAALVASRCVPLGIGTDLASSIRIPAAFNGVVGFKPSQGRTTYAGGNSARKTGFDQLGGFWIPSLGPLAHSAEDCIEFFKIQCHANTHFDDPLHCPTSFNQEMFDRTLKEPSKIRVGILTEIKFLPVSPAVKRAVELTRAVLVEAGYEVVDYSISEEDYSEAKDYLIGMVCNGTVRHLARDWDSTGEKVAMGFKLNVLILTAGPILRSILLSVLKCVGMGRLVRMLRNAYMMSNDQLDACYRDREEFCYRFSQKWQNSGIDVLVTPAFPSVTYPDALADDMGAMLDYTYLWSILCYPCATIPVTTVQENEETYSDNINDAWTSLLKKNAIGSKGLPVSVQVISHFHEDEKTLAVLKQIDDKLNFRMSLPNDAK